MLLYTLFHTMLYMFYVANNLDLKLKFQLAAFTLHFIRCLIRITWE